MPLTLNPDCLFMAPSHDALLKRLKANLNQISNISPKKKMLEWKTMFKAEVINLCSVELVQIEEVSMPGSECNLHMYMILFNRLTAQYKT